MGMRGKDSGLLGGSRGFMSVAKVRAKVNVVLILIASYAAVVLIVAVIWKVL